MTEDTSNGWDHVSEKFVAHRSEIGCDIVTAWTDKLPEGGPILDIGCGFGWPLSTLLHERGFEIYGIEPSPKLFAEFQKRLPQAKIACETVEVSGFFDRQFDGVLAIGLLFLLTPSKQRSLFPKISRAMKPNARFLFSAPYQICEWDDLLTGRRSCSLGTEEYQTLAARAGLALSKTYTDEGDNHYFDFTMA